MTEPLDNPATPDVDLDVDLDDDTNDVAPPPPAGQNADADDLAFDDLPNHDGEDDLDDEDGRTDADPADPEGSDVSQ